MWTFLVKCESWNSVNEKEEVTYHLLRASSFAEAVQEIEKYFGDELNSFTITCREDYLGEITKECYHASI